MSNEQPAGQRLDGVAASIADAVLLLEAARRVDSPELRLQLLANVFGTLRASADEVAYVRKLIKQKLGIERDPR